MPLTYTAGRLGSLKVGSSYTSVLGVQHMDIQMSKRDGWPDPPDSCPAALALYNIDWAISGTITEDLSDSGQDLIRAAFFGGSKLVFKAYVDATHYYASDAEVAEYNPEVDAEGHNQVSVTFRPWHGSSLTNSL